MRCSRSRNRKNAATAAIAANCDDSTAATATPSLAQRRRSVAAEDLEDAGEDDERQRGPGQPEPALQERAAGR